MKSNLQINFFCTSYFCVDDAERRYIGRQYIEPITKRTFFASIERGIWAWSVEEAAELNRQWMDEGIPQQNPLVLDVPDWIHLKSRSFLRRSFEHYDEFEDESSNLIFYIDDLLSRDDMKIRLIQKNMRTICRFPCRQRPATRIEKMSNGGGETWLLPGVNSTKHTGWISSSYSLRMPAECIEESRILNAWTYIRRRSKFVGEFNSITGEEWEEVGIVSYFRIYVGLTILSLENSFNGCITFQYVDSVSSEFLYWHEDSNTHQWIKPVIHRVDDSKVLLFIATNDSIIRTY